MLRITMILVLGISLIVAAGCKVNPEVYDEKIGVAELGDPAVDVARARALQYKDTIDMIEREREDMKKRRGQLLTDAKEYRTRAGKARYDASMNTTMRKAYAAQYRTIATQREEAAARYGDLIDAYAARIRLLSSLQRNQEADALRFKSMKTAKPK